MYQGLGDVWGTNKAVIQANLNAGNAGTLWYCNSFAGQFLSPEACAIPDVGIKDSTQVAATNHPLISSLIGPGTVGVVGDAYDDTENYLSSGGSNIFLIIGLVAFVLLSK